MITSSAKDEMDHEIEDILQRESQIDEAEIERRKVAQTEQHLLSVRGMNAGEPVRLPITSPLSAIAEGRIQNYHQVIRIEKDGDGEQLVVFGMPGSLRDTLLGFENPDHVDKAFIELIEEAHRQCLALVEANAARVLDEKRISDERGQSISASVDFVKEEVRRELAAKVQHEAMKDQPERKFSGDEVERHVHLRSFPKSDLEGLEKTTEHAIEEFQRRIGKIEKAITGLRDKAEPHRLEVQRAEKALSGDFTVAEHRKYKDKRDEASGLLESIEAVISKHESEISEIETERAATSKRLDIVQACLASKALVHEWSLFGSRRGKAISHLQKILDQRSELQRQQTSVNRLWSELTDDVEPLVPVLAIQENPKVFVI